MAYKVSISISVSKVSSFLFCSRSHRCAEDLATLDASRAKMANETFFSRLWPYLVKTVLVHRFPSVSHAMTVLESGAVFDVARPIKKSTSRGGTP